MSKCQWRTREMARRVDPLPGCVPYENRRPLNVSSRFDHCSLAEFFARTHPHVAAHRWQQAASQGRLLLDERVVSTLEHRVRGGNRIVHIIPDEVEPAVDPSVVFLYEDDDVVLVHKPATLPMHPCGRFNKNTLVSLVGHAFNDLALLPVHRLDADTSGVAVLAKHRQAARYVSAQFQAREVEKEYLAQVHGKVPDDLGPCDTPLTAAPGARGKRETGGRLAARTDFEVLRVNPGHSLLRARPQSGRTNQIRVHLASLGYPIVGDQAYGEEGREQDFSSGAQLHLHAHALTLRLPNTRRQRFEAPPPLWVRTALSS